METLRHAFPNVDDESLQLALDSVDGNILKALRLLQLQYGNHVIVMHFADLRLVGGTGVMGRRE